MTPPVPLIGELAVEIDHGIPGPPVSVTARAVSSTGTRPVQVEFVGVEVAIV
jgi:hypothetical protein